MAEGESDSICYGNIDQALSEADTQLRLFGKPEVAGRRRMGVALARAATTQMAREKATAAAATVSVEVEPSAGSGQEPSALGG
jgi:phosphoribosylglycinamide formyltransferase 2